MLDKPDSANHVDVLENLHYSFLIQIYERCCHIGLIPPQAEAVKPKREPRCNEFKEPLADIDPDVLNRREIGHALYKFLVNAVNNGQCPQSVFNKFFIEHLKFLGACFIKNEYSRE